MTGRRYGGFWRRLFAFFIDQIILYFVSLILFLIGLLAQGLRGEKMGCMLASPEGLMQGMGSVALIYMAACILASMAYYTWFHGTGGRTPGKMLLGLRVIQASGDPITPGLAFLRWVGYFFSTIPFFLGFLWIAFDCRKQGWHDRIAATLVIFEEGEADRVVIDATPTAPATTEAPPLPQGPGPLIEAGEESPEKPNFREFPPPT